MWNSSLLAGTWIEHLIQALEVKQLVRSHGLLGCVWRYEEWPLPWFPQTSHKEPAFSAHSPSHPSICLLLNCLFTCVFTPTGCEIPENKDCISHFWTPRHKAHSSEGLWKLNTCQSMVQESYFCVHQGSDLPKVIELVCCRIWGR